MFRALRERRQARELAQALEALREVEAPMTTREDYCEHWGRPMPRVHLAATGSLFEYCECSETPAKREAETTGLDALRRARAEAREAWKNA